MNDNRKSLWSGIKKRLDRLDEIVQKGGRMQLAKKKTGNRFLDKLSGWWVDSQRCLIRLDSRHAFKQFPYQAIAFRTRTNAEATVADFLHKRGVKVEYEKELLFPAERKRALPDFYLPGYDVYIEFWGLSGRFKKYDLARAEKEELYRRYGIKYISLEPDDQFRLKWVLPERFKEATGSKLPENKKQANSFESLKVYTRRYSSMLTATKWAILAAILLLLGTFVVPNFWARMKTSSDQIGKTIDEHSSDKTLINIVKEDLRAKANELQMHKVQAAEQSGDVKTQAELVAKETAELAENELIMHNGSALLEKSKPGDTLMVGTNQCTWEDLNKAIMKRVSDSITLKDNLKRDSEVLQAQKSSFDFNQQRIDEAENFLQDKWREVERDEREIASKRATKTAMDALENLKNMANPINMKDDNLSKALAAVKHRNIVLDTYVHPVIPPHEVDTKPLGTKEANAVGAVKEYFSPNGNEITKALIKATPSVKPKATPSATATPAKAH